MEKNESMKKRCPVVLPEGKFADEYDSCSTCDHSDEYRDHILWGEQVFCTLDGKWHKENDVCRNYSCT